MSAIMDNTQAPMSGIMDNIPAPPALDLHCVAFSAPESRIPTPPSKAHKKRNAFSMPATPRKAPRSPIVKKKPLSPIRSPTKSPMRALRGHRYHATFAKYNPRDHANANECPVHSYSSMEQELAVKPTTAVGGVKFSDAPRDLMLPKRAVCPVHVYASARSTLSALGSASFAKAEHTEVPDVCPVHAYSSAGSSMRSRPATFAKDLTPRQGWADTSGPPVHAYAPPTSSLRSSGVAGFGTDRQGRDAFQQTARALAPVHAYAAPASTLRTVGGASFGHASRDTLPGLSRTGLVSLTSTPTATKDRRPRTLKPLPRTGSLQALAPTPETPKHDADGAGSPREVEAVLM